MGVDFANVAVARILCMSDLEMLLWVESGAHRILHMLTKHMRSGIVLKACRKIDAHEIAATSISNFETLLWFVFRVHRQSHMLAKQ